MGSLTTALQNRNDPSPTCLGSTSPVSAAFAVLLSNYHQQASAAVCILALMSKRSSQIRLELGSAIVTAEILLS